MPGMKKTMGEFKSGALRSGSKAGPVVKSKKQAIAIGLSEERKEGKGAPPSPPSGGYRDGGGKPMSAEKHKAMYSFQKGK